MAKLNKPTIDDLYLVDNAKDLSLILMGRTEVSIVIMSPNLVDKDYDKYYLEVITSYYSHYYKLVGTDFDTAKEVSNKLFSNIAKYDDQSDLIKYLKSQGFVKI